MCVCACSLSTSVYVLHSVCFKDQYRKWSFISHSNGTMVKHHWLHGCSSVRSHYVNAWFFYYIFMLNKLNKTTASFLNASQCLPFLRIKVRGTIISFHIFKSNQINNNQPHQLNWDINIYYYNYFACACAFCMNGLKRYLLKLPFSCGKNHSTHIGWHGMKLKEKEWIAFIHMSEMKMKIV